MCEKIAADSMYMVGLYGQLCNCPELNRSCSFPLRFVMTSARSCTRSVKVGMWNKTYPGVTWADMAACSPDILAYDLILVNMANSRAHYNVSKTIAI